MTSLRVRPIYLTRFFLEAIRGLLAVPNGSREWKLSSDPVLADGTERSTSKFLGLNVVGFHPEDLELGVVLLGELEALQDSVHLFEVALVKVDQSLGFENTLVTVKHFTGWQAP